MKNDIQKYDALYLSPHLDDVALSCGGQIAQRTAAGQRVLIVTLMAGDPPAGPLSAYAQSLHDRWQLDAVATAARRAEDAAACQILGADYQHWSLPDCIYRRHSQTGEALYTSDEMIFAEVRPHDIELAEQLAQQLRQLPASEQLLVPLTVGHHVDHQLTRLAAERWRSPETLIYYEEYPYADDPAEVQRALQADSWHWQAETVSLTAAALEKKIAAVSAFVSQLSTFFADEADLRRQIMAYTELIQGERLWYASKKYSVSRN